MDESLKPGKVTSVTLFTYPIHFDADDEFVEPQAWEPVSIPDFVIEFASDFDFNSEDIRNGRCAWLYSLHSQGYTAVRISVSGNAFKAEATKSTWKG